MLLVYMFCYSEVKQLLKIPTLIQHFNEHRTGDPSISFLQFIAIHYNGIFEKDADYQRDQQLPFRTSECLSSTVSVCELESMEIVLDPLYEQTETDFILRNDTDRSFITPQDIFQPPRCA